MNSGLQTWPFNAWMFSNAIKHQELSGNLTSSNPPSETPESYLKAMDTRDVSENSKWLF